MHDLKTSVFISYSRVDGVFAEKLRVALTARGFEAYLDKEDILPGEPWRARLDGLILAADAVVFIISPDSIASEHCAWEVARTLELRKVIAPLYWRAIPQGAAPQGLADRNYVFFDLYECSGMEDEALFVAALAKLETALNISEFLWVREHTKWVARAADWDRAEPARPDGKLLPAGDIAAVEGWVRLKPATAPDLPPVLADYLRASIAKEDRETARLRRTAGRAFVKPAVQALAEGFSDRAVRLAAAGALLADDLDLNVVPELWSTAAPAIFRSKTHAVLKGHAEALFDAAFSSDGNRVVTASSDRTARVWDAETGAEIAVMRGHQDSLMTAAFSPDGKRVGTASLDRTARLWDAETGLEIAVLRGHEDTLWSAVFSPDGRRVLTTSWDHTARLWDAVTSNEIAVLKAHDDAVFGVEFSPDGKRMVTASDDETARLWDAETGTEVAVLKGQEKLWSAAFSPDGKRVVTTPKGATVRLWDDETTKQIAVMRAHEGPVFSAAFSPDGTRVVTASDDRTARLWDAGTGTELAVLRAHEGPVFSAAFSFDGKHVATASDDHTARLWDDNGTAVALLKAHEDAVLGAAFSPDGKRVVTASRDLTARLWDENGTEIAVLKGHKSSVRSAAFSPDGKRVVTASRDSTARLWDADGRETAVLKGHTERLRSAMFSPDGKRVISVADDGTARLWDAETGAEITVLNANGLLGAAFSPDGRHVATACYDKTVRLWDVSRSEVITRGRALVLTAALAHGIGWRTLSERMDFLMQDAPDDMFSAALTWLDGRAGAVAETVAAVHAPLHPNCYLSATGFAAKFGLTPPRRG